MKRSFLYLPILLALALAGCRTDDSFKPDEPDSGPGRLALTLTTRVGTTVGDPLTQYVKSLNLLLFRENEAGNFVLYRTEVLTKAQLDALSDGEGDTEPGFTALKAFTFDNVPLDNYQIVGIANVVDSTGAALRDVTLQGATLGNDKAQIMAAVLDGSQASRLFLGMTGTVTVGATGAEPQQIRLFRKVAMFALTLEKIPDVVNQIAMDIANIYGSFDMAGTYTPGSSSTVNAFNLYSGAVQDSITLTYVTLPTVSGDSTTFQSTFYLVNGPKQIVTLPKYVLKANTITKVTATIDIDQPGNLWKVNVGTVISADVEWNVDQEPPITI